MSICNNCGVQFDSPYCPNCGTSAQVPTVMSPPYANNYSYQQNQFMQQPPPPQFQQYKFGRICPRCGCPNIIVTTEQNMQVKNRGCLGWIGWILLACCTCGLILIIPLVTNTKVNSFSRTINICQNCGNRWY